MKMIKGFILLISVCFCLMGQVYAYEENTFTNDECINNNSWMNSATTEYKLNQETGQYELSGETYQDYKAASKTGQYVFYGISSDGTILYGYVPDYAKTVATDAGKKDVNKRQIITTSSCANTLQVRKTIIGVDYSDNIDDSNNTNTDTNTNTNTNTDTDTNATVDTQNNPTLDSPNTASAATVSGIIAGVLLFGVAAFALFKLKKSNNN